ncbi:hypothetical protein [Anaerobutyricum soehngenii]|uniref:hypothetical protein n=1 Tax=Anaerobutyricum soehngenii TaxID=105843 RepID=UPI001ADD73AC|nr:hypothetical protein [Anaerobutyricum soehngenii]
MLIRILNTLRSRIWDMVLFLFSVLWRQMEISIFILGKIRGLSRGLWFLFRMKISKRNTLSAKIHSSKS